MILAELAINRTLIIALIGRIICSGYFVPVPIYLISYEDILLNLPARARLS